MSLTSTPSSKKWYHRRGLWIALLAVVVIGMGAYIFIKGLSHDSDDELPDEKTMPAIKVVVSNGCGYERLATEFALFLSTKNIEVKRLTDTPKPIYDKSVIVVKYGDTQDLQRLQKMTGIQRYTLASNPDFDAPFLIILGRDYEEFMKK